MKLEMRTRLTLLVLLALSLLRIPSALAVQMLLPEASVAPVANYIASMVQALLLFALPGWLLRPVPLKPLQKPALPAYWGLLPLVAAVLARTAATPLNRWWTNLLNAPVSAMPSVDGIMDALVLLLATVVIPAVSEELFFRGALLGNLLRSSSRMQALLLTTAMFALMHGNLAGLPGHLLIGFVLSVLMLHNGRLAEPIVAHMLFNLLALLRWGAGPILPWVCGLLLCGLTGWLLSGFRWTARKRLPLAESLLCAAILLAMGLQYLM